MALSGFWLRVVFTFCCGISYLFYGYDQGFMSGVIIADDWLLTMDHPSTFMQGLITSIYELGCLAGCLASFVVSEHFGRKRPLLAGTTIAIIGAVLQTAANGLPMFIVGRIVSGVGTGINTSIIPTWQAETLPAKVREQFGSCQYILVCFGASVSYWMNYGLSYAGGELEWRFAVAAQIVFALILMAIIPFMPESPRWLMNHSRISEAMDILVRMHGTQNERDDEVQTEVKLINQAIELEHMGHSVGWLELFKNRPETQNLRRIILGWCLMAMVMLSGVCSIGYYISYLFETTVGLSHNLSLLLSGFNGLWYMASAIVIPFIIGRVGKRGCMIVGAIGMGFCFLAMSLGIRSGSFGASIVVIVGFFLYYTFFALGWLAIPWLYCAEIMPLHLRSKGTAFTTSSNWLWNFATVMFTPSLMTSQGWKGYLVFCILNFAFVPIVWLFYPETSGRRLEQIDAIFYKNSPFVGGTQWAKKGKFEADGLEVALGETGKGGEQIDHVEAS